MFEYIILLIVSFFAALLSGFVGGGGGLITLPMLLFLGLPFALAMGTNKMAAIFMGIAATARFFKEKFIDYKLALLFIGVGLPASIWGAVSVLSIPDHIAKIIIGVVIILLTIYSHKNKKFGMEYDPKNRRGMGLIVGSIGIFAVSFYNSAFAAGSGFLLNFLSIKWFGLDYKRAVAHNSFVLSILWNAMAAGTFAMKDSVQWDWVPILIIGFSLGAYLGAHLAVAKGNVWVKRIFEIVSVIIGTKLIYDGVIVF